MKTNQQQDASVIWYSDYECYFMFEVSISQLTPLLPKSIIPTEVRPGVGLIGMGFISFNDDNIVTPNFREISLSAVVQNDLSLIDDSLPKFALFPISITSNSHDFLNQAKSTDYMPSMFLSNVEINLRKNKASGFFQHQSNTILDFKLTALPEERFFSDAEDLFQVFTINDEYIYVANVAWSGKIYETQKKSIFESLALETSHEFFKGITIDDPLNSLYLYMIANPGEVHSVRFPAPQRYRRLV